MEINLACPGKQTQLTKNPSNMMTNEWKRNNALIYGQLLNTLEPSKFECRCWLFVDNRNRDKTYSSSKAYF